MSFWPDEINSDVVVSPRDIMQDAASELEQRTLRLSVSIVPTKLSDRIVFAFEVSNREVQATVNLFEASHQIGQPYPVAIDPPVYNLPNFLMRTRFVSASRNKFETFVSDIVPKEFQATPEKAVKNQWVCATPLEFKKKLTELFAREDVTARIIRLLALKKNDEVSVVVSGGPGDGIGVASDENVKEATE